MGLLSRGFALAKNEGVCESGPSRGNMHRSTTSEVEGREIVQPSIRIPRPTDYRAVNDSRPEEAEYQTRDDSASLERTANHNLNGTRAVWDVSRSLSAL